MKKRAEECGREEVSSDEGMDGAIIFFIFIMLRNFPELQGIMGKWVGLEHLRKRAGPGRGESSG